MSCVGCLSLYNYNSYINKKHKTNTNSLTSSRSSSDPPEARVLGARQSREHQVLQDLSACAHRLHTLASISFSIPLAPTRLGHSSLVLRLCSFSTIGGLPHLPTGPSLSSCRVCVSSGWQSERLSWLRHICLCNFGITVRPKPSLASSTLHPRRMSAMLVDSSSIKHCSVCTAAHLVFLRTRIPSSASLKSRCFRPPIPAPDLCKLYTAVCPDHASSSTLRQYAPAVSPAHSHRVREIF